MLIIIRLLGFLVDLVSRGIAAGKRIFEVLDEGKLAETGTHQELMKKDGIYHHLYTMNYASADSQPSSSDTAAN